MSESMVERLGDALIGKVARQTKSDLGNTGDDNYSDLAIGGLDSEESVITLDRQALARAALSALREPTEAMMAAAFNECRNNGACCVACDGGRRTQGVRDGIKHGALLGNHPRGESACL